MKPKNYPKTLEEARKIRYARWAGNPNGTPFDETRCAYDVPENDGVTPLLRQCLRGPGHGPGGLYCKQHGLQVRYLLELAD